MDITPTLEHQDPPVPTRTRRRFGLLGAVFGTLLVVLVARFATSDLTMFESVGERACQGSLCAERVHSPDLLLVPGHREVRVGHEIDGSVQGRFYAAEDPFGEYSDVKIVWTDAGVSLSDQAATLTWDTKTLAGLDD